MKKRIIWIGAIVLLLGAAAIWYFKPFSKVTASYQFETARVEKGTISNTVTATGTLEAITTVEVGTQVSGVIENLLVDFNSNVKQGQLLAELDPTPLMAQLEQSKANVDQAEAELEYQSANYDRYQALYEKQLIAKTDFDQATYNYNKAKASLNSARSVYNRNKINLDYATIHSPIDGVVLDRAVEKGQTVAASFNTPTLFTIANDLTQMQVESDVDEADIGKVKQGERVEFTVDAYPDDKFAGTVSEVRLQPVVTNNVVTYTVIINAPNPEKKLMPGMTASITIFVEEKSDVMIVSGKALRFTPDTEYMTAMFKEMEAPEGMPPMGEGQKLASLGVSSDIPGGEGTQGKSQGTFAGNGPTGTGAAAPGMGTGMPPAGNFGGSGGENGPTMLWVKDENGIHPQPVEIGINNGSEVEILSGLDEGQEVVLSMTRTESRRETDSTEARSPFMPQPPGRP